MKKPWNQMEMSVGEQVGGTKIVAAYAWVKLAQNLNIAYA